MERARALHRRHAVACTVAGIAAGAIIALRSIRLGLHVLREARTQRYLSSLQPDDCVHLFIHPRWSHGPNFFPHCLKVEAFLRLARVPYVVHQTHDVSLSPNGKLPFMVLRGVVLAEGDSMVQYLTEELELKVDHSITRQDHSRGWMLQRMIETSFNYGLYRTTFVDRPRFMMHVLGKEFGLQPSLANVLVRKMRQAIITILNATGFGDLTEDQYELEFLRDVQAVEALLRQDKGGHLFVLGPDMTSYDCSVYAWLHIARELSAAGGPALNFVAASGAIRDYLQRVETRLFPDLTAILSSGDHVQTFTW